MPNHNQVRVMNNNGRVYIDLADERGQVIEIGQYGWTVTETMPVSFMRTPNTLPLPVPERGGSIDELWDMFDVPDDFFISIMVWLLDALCGDGVHPILTINSPNASKLPLAIPRSLVDPSSAPPFSGVHDPKSSFGKPISVTYSRSIICLSSQAIFRSCLDAFPPAIRRSWKLAAAKHPPISLRIGES
jgi:hypothetical protein